MEAMPISTRARCQLADLDLWFISISDEAGILFAEAEIDEFNPVFPFDFEEGKSIHYNTYD